MHPLNKTCHVTCRPCFQACHGSRQQLFHTIMSGSSGVDLDAESSQMTTVRKKRKGRANAVAGPSASHAEEHKGIPSLRGRRKLGLLAGLPNLPLDILFEVNLIFFFATIISSTCQILGHLDPYDVLKLARTTKDFRSLLLDRSSSSIWKAAFSNIPDLPDCPPGMSEPAWADLVFSPRCSVNGILLFPRKVSLISGKKLVLLYNIRPKSSMDV